MNYDTNKARFTGRSCVAGNVAVRMLPTLPVYPSLARSRNALLSGAARNAASGPGRVMSACNNGCAPRGRRAVLSLFVALARECGLPPRAPDVPRRGQRQGAAAEGSVSEGDPGRPGRDMVCIGRDTGQ